MKTLKSLLKTGCLAVSLALSGSIRAESYTLNIQPQPLDRALHQLAEQTGIRLLYATDLVAEKNAPELQGRFTPEQALQYLLQGSGFEITPRPDGSYALRSQAVRTSRQSPVEPRPAQSMGTLVISGASITSSNSYTVPDTNAATGLDLAFKETPQSMSSFTELAMQDMNLLTATDVLLQTPGVSVIENGVQGAGRVQYFSRGFAINNYQMDGVMVNNAALGGRSELSNRSNAGMQDSFMYQRMDIMRGSTGLTTGGGDPSASLSFVRKRPTHEPQGQINLKYSSWNNLRGEVDYSTPFNASGSWRGRVVASWQQGDSYIDRIEHEGTAVYGITEWDILPTTTLSLGFSRLERRTDGAGPHNTTRRSRGSDSSLGCGYTRCTFIYETHLGRSWNGATQWSYNDFEWNNYFLELSHYFGNGWQLAASGQRFETDSDRLYGVLGTEYYFYPAYDLASISYGREIIENETDVFDVYLKGFFTLFDRDHDFIIGTSGYDSENAHLTLQSYSSYAPEDFGTAWDTGTYADRQFARGWFRPSQWNNGNIPIPADFTQGSTAGSFPSKQRGTYASLRLRPTGFSQLIIGARQVQYWHTREYWPDPYKPNGVTYLHREPKSTIPYAGLVLEITRDINAYASYTGINRVNDYTLGQVGGIADKNGNYMGPIEGHTTEMGFRAGWFDNRLNMAISWFSMTQNNIPVAARPLVQVQSPWNGDWVTAHEGVDGYKVYGWDINITGEITPEWRITAGYVNQQQEVPLLLEKAEILEDITGSTRFPEHSFKFFTRYDFTDALTLGAGGRWQSTTDLNIWEKATVDKNGNGVPDPLTQSAYWVFDAMARYRINNQLTLGLNVNNLFDKYYFTNASEGNYGTPRNFSASLFYKF